MEELESDIGPLSKRRDLAPARLPRSTNATPKPTFRRLDEAIPILPVRGNRFFTHKLAFRYVNENLQEPTTVENRRLQQYDQLTVKIMDNTEEHNDSNPITIPYYCAQDVDKFTLNYHNRKEQLHDLPPNRIAINEERQSKSKKCYRKRNRSQESSSSSYIIRRDKDKQSHRLIKISICELNEQEENVIPDLSANTSVQYVVMDSMYDEVLDATNCLIKK
ncbi:unnamed protein product [Parnassius mnemosyne]|uniref:Uncharacterized protein n=1 Tax=Parnassius mnemosyne TaxID=213953 RepID=A0AAV1K6A5_9NEOP